jgi:hypothetical protein
MAALTAWLTLVKSRVVPSGVDEATAFEPIVVPARRDFR